MKVKDGVLLEGLVSTGSKYAEEPDPLDPEIIGRLDNGYKYEPISTDYYPSEEGGFNIMHLLYLNYIIPNPTLKLR